jgi:hypothetical protein
MVLSLFAWSSMGYFIGYTFGKLSNINNDNLLATFSIFLVLGVTRGLK